MTSGKSFLHLPVLLLVEGLCTCRKKTGFKHAHLFLYKNDVHTCTFFYGALNTEEYLIAGYVMMVAIVLDKAPRRKAVKADNITGELSLPAKGFCVRSLKIRPFSCS